MSSRLGQLLRMIADFLREVAPDLGTSLLGVAAILLARAIPSSDFGEFDYGLIRLSIGSALLGLVLRRFDK